MRDDDDDDNDAWKATTEKEIAESDVFVVFGTDLYGETDSDTHIEWKSFMRKAHSSGEKPVHINMGKVEDDVVYEELEENATYKPRSYDDVEAGREAERKLLQWDWTPSPKAMPKDIIPWILELLDPEEEHFVVTSKMLCAFLHLMAFGPYSMFMLFYGICGFFWVLAVLGVDGLPIIMICALVCLCLYHCINVGNLCLYCWRGYKHEDLHLHC